MLELDLPLLLSELDDGLELDVEAGEGELLDDDELDEFAGCELEPDSLPAAAPRAGESRSGQLFCAKPGADSN